MKGFYCVLISLATYLWVAVCSADESPTEFAQILERIAQVQQQFSVAGLGLVIVDGRNTLHQACLGLANREEQIPVDDDTVFRVGSITKTFTSLAVLRLVEQGKISLKDPVSKHVGKTPYVNTYYSSTPIRIAHLLEHTAGFRDLTQKEFDFKEVNWSLKKSLAYDPVSRTTAWMPGNYHSYTNAGAGVAAYLVEQVSQQSFESYVQEQIFQPLNLTDATFFLEDGIKSRLAIGYNTDGKSIIPYWHMLFRSFGAINMRVKDMAKFVRMLINYGQTENGESVFSATSIRRLESPATTLAARNGLGYGYGLGNYQWLRDGVLFHGHGGDADGYLARYAYTRENNRGYFVVINAYNNEAMRKIRRIVETWLIQSIEKRPIPAPYILNRNKRKEIIGDYESVTNRFSWTGDSEPKRLKVFSERGELFTQLGSENARLLVPVNENHFRRANQPIATISIVNNTVGVPVLQGDLGNFRKVE